MISTEPPPAYIAPYDVISFLLDPFAEEVCMTWTDAEVTAFREVCARLQVEPRSLLAVMANESGCNPAAHNFGGNAAGLIQFMPDTLRDLGWTQGTDDFLKLSVLQQLPFVERYFDARLPAIKAAGSGIGALYVATFLPAFLSHAGDATYVLCARQGPCAWAYAPNKSFDVDGLGWITVGMLVNAAERSLARPGPQAVLAQVEAQSEADLAALAANMASVAAQPPPLDGDGTA